MKVLLTGSTGYIGRRLKRILLEDQNISLRLFVRNKRTVSKDIINKVEVIEGDTFNIESLKKALEGVDVAYYLIHSLNDSDYKNLDKISAQNFVNIAEQSDVKKIVYLGGLGIKGAHTSKHLLSRIETGEILSSSSKVQCIWIRAGVIIGSGSASFEIIRNLVEKLPVMTTPKWVSTQAQPIAVSDVLKYLQESLCLEYPKNITIDIGADQLSYKDMMLQTAKVLELNRTLIPIPLLSIKLSSYWLNLFTPVPYKVAKALIEGLESEVIIQNDNAKQYFPQITPISYKEAVEKAQTEIKEDQIISRWNDSDGKVWDEIHDKEFHDAIFVDRQIKDISYLDKVKVFQSFTSIGGTNGWFEYSLLWELRGLIDKLIGGVGSKRGRRSECDLRTGDCLDFWKVVDIQKDERVLLYAQMKLPGKAWLEFKIKDNQLIQSAYFYPKGIWGRVYWYLVLPFHYFVFRSLIKGIIKKAIKNS